MFKGEDYLFVVRLMVFLVCSYLLQKVLFKNCFVFYLRHTVLKINFGCQ